MSRRKPKLKLKPGALYDQVEECVKGGLEGGWNRAHKHLSKPTPDMIREEQLRWIILNLEEEFDLSP